LKPKTEGSRRTPRSPAQASKARKYSAGIEPSARQFETADGLTPARLATAEVPPNASMMSSTDLSIPEDSSCDLKSSSVSFAGMDFRGNEFILDPMDKKAVGERIEIWLKADDLSAAEVCRELAIKESAFSQWKNGKHLLPLKIAELLCRNYGLSLDWLYRGELRYLPQELRVRINEISKLHKRRRA
jgi:hypothetical protein